MDGLVAGLNGDVLARSASLAQLRSRLGDLASQARAAADSSQRRLARRLLGGVIVASRDIPDPEYRKLLEKVRPAVFP
ncbi:MAG: hypothetical protein LAP40_03450 [Acidobacteriia bacterium]|nr:hypothetical protein [Terriglobia bacterium]